METILEVAGLCRSFVQDRRQNHVLRNVSFAVRAGEMVAVMGPSGSGKSTLLYCVSGMDRPTSGTVRFCGRELGALSEAALAALRLDEMGFVFQQMHMLKNMTVLDNILLPAMQSAKNRGRRRETAARAEALMRRLSIIETADSDIRAVSGGQLQRACICRAVINAPRMLFADEPTGALNRAGAGEVMRELTRLHDEGATILLVTHDAQVAAQCTRVMYLVDGQLRGEHRPDPAAPLRTRERAMNHWLMEQGW